ncbi:TPA: hypothetical protein DD712_03220 [Candidatus Acetothermia bacterium]|nr:hypothetical protein [Candidatus Acetothermia bacterium]
MLMNRNGRQWAFSILMVVAVLVVTSVAVLSEEIVVVLDSNLEAALREALALPESEITVANMEELVELYAPGRDIKDLTGLEWAVNLKVLTLFDNKIEDLSPLSGLTALEELSLGWNRITDISPLAGLAELKKFGVRKFGGNSRKFE